LIAEMLGRINIEFFKAITPYFYSL
jgi:hypothetical protein